MVVELLDYLVDLQFHWRQMVVAVMLKLILQMVQHHVVACLIHHVLMV
jgi:hypothetical protein